MLLLMSSNRWFLLSNWLLLLSTCPLYHQDVSNNAALNTSNFNSLGGVGAVGCVGIADGLQSNNKLLSLLLSSNNIKSEGAATIFSSLTTNTTLTYLDISSNNLDNRMLKSMEVNLSNNKHLKHIEMNYNNYNNNGITYLRNLVQTNSTLLTIGMKQNRYQQQQQEQQQQHQPITRSSRESIQQLLQRNKRLQQLQQQLQQQNPQFNTLEISNLRLHNNIGREFIELLISSICPLHTISFISCELPQKAITRLLSMLSYNDRITALSFANQSIGTAAFKSLSRVLNKHEVIPSLIYLSITYTTDSTDMKIGSTGADLLATAISTGPSLTYLSLDGSGLGRSGIKSIALALQQQRTYKRPLKSSAMSLSLSSTLPLSVSLSYLSVASNQLRDPAVQILCNSLTEHIGITDLNISNNLIGNDGATDILKLVTNNNNIQRVEMKQQEILRIRAKITKIKSKVSRAIAEQLERNRQQQQQQHQQHERERLKTQQRIKWEQKQQLKLQQQRQQNIEEAKQRKKLEAFEKEMEEFKASLQ